MKTTEGSGVRQIVIIAGSGRSGTTWLGSILDSYERAEYFYEIHMYPELDFGSANLLRAKYPLTSWWDSRPRWACSADRLVCSARVKLNLGRRSAQRALRLHKDYGFKKRDVNVHLFKIVNLLEFSLGLDELALRFGDGIKVVHIIRNPFANIVSELRQHAKNMHEASARYRERLLKVLDNDRLAQYHELVATYENGTFVEHIALLWWLSNAILLENQSVPVHRVIYEHLCRDTYGECSAIFRFLGWPISDQTRSHIDATTNVQVSESGNWSIRKNSGESMERWRREISNDDYEMLKRLLSNCALLGLWTEHDLDRVATEVCEPSVL
jgi:hypothetical protein